MDLYEHDIQLWKKKKTFKTSRIYAIFFIFLITRKQTTLTV